MPAMQPFLMFQKADAEDAMTLYTSLFDDGEIIDAVRWQDGEPGRSGSIKLARFRAAGQTVLASDSPVKHAFEFTPSSSFFVDCDSDDQLERLFDALGDGGTILMPLGSYGFSRRFGWVNDRFGVSWQLNLP
jgi:predicted 3-demethylubiquinone-9 3-methyltransferase (glyoxalase superfamily)